MIKWLKRKIDIHNANLDYGNYEDQWDFEGWLWNFAISITICLAGLYVGFFIKLWAQATIIILGGIILLLYLCWKLKLFSKSNIENYNEEDFDPYNLDNLQFIWGIKSWDDLTSSEPNLHTMNDLDIIYNKDTKLYSLSIETVYQFKQGKIGEVNYLNDLLKKFTEYMKENNYNTNELYRFQWGQPQIKLEAETIPELYTSFRIFVEGYNAVYGGKQNETICDI